MTSESRKPFSDAVKFIDDLLHPKGPPVELQPVQVASIEETAQLFADELQEQVLKTPLVGLLQDLGINPAVDGVGLVIIHGRYLSIRVLTDLNRSGEEWDNKQQAIEDRYDAFAQSLYDALPESRSISWGLSYYNSAGEDVSVLPEILAEEIRKEADASVLSFAMYPKPAFLQST